ncbi:MAG TPA: phage tail sheath C-terminal domain-containing protein [Gaiellaceae bacterium]
MSTPADSIVAGIRTDIARVVRRAAGRPDDEALWRNVRREADDIAFAAWRNGALVGSRPEEAFFVRCDRTTMTQDDIDNGRLVVLVGLAPVKPAEFVIFRIEQLLRPWRPRR